MSAGIKVKPVELTVKKWLERARAGATLYAERVKSPRRDPIKAAIAKRADLEAKMQKKETWDKWETRLSAVGMEGWLKATLTKGVERYPRGIEFGKDKFADFYEQFSKHLEAGLAKVLAMPKVTLEDSIRRAAEMIRWNAQFKYVPRVK